MDGQAQAPTGRDGYEITKLTGVYNIDDTMLGRTAFKWAGARHRKRCALYDLTHDGGKVTPEWEACERQLQGPIEFVARNQRPHDVEVATGGKPPCIVAHTAAGLLLIVLARDIENCEGDPAKLVSTINDAIPRWSLHWAWGVHPR